MPGITLANQVVFGSTFAVSGVLLLPLLFHFWKLRDVKVIRSRNPILVISHMIAHYLWTFGILMINTVNLSCVGTYSFIYLTLTLTMTLLFLRMIHTWQEYELSCKKLAYFSKRPDCPIKCKLERSKMQKSTEYNNARSLLFAGAPVVLVAIMLISVQFTQGNKLDQGYDQCNRVFMPASITAIVEVGLLTLVSIDFLKKLRSIEQDTLGIVKEYSFWLVANLMLMIYGTIHIILGRQVTQGVDIVSFVLNQLPFFVLMYHSLWIPIQRARRWQGRMNESSTNSQRSSEAISSPKQISFKQLTAELAQVLANSAESETFSNFLKAEFSVENFLFWKDVENFRNGIRLNERITLREQAMFLRDQFISDDSPLSVNISAKNRAEILERIEKDDIAITMFDAAQQEIFMLMVKDSFMRYRSKKLSFSAPSATAISAVPTPGAVSVAVVPENIVPRKEEV